MNLTTQQIAGKPKKIGVLDGKSVLEVTTKGGFSMVVAPATRGFETLGAGPHPAIARHIALKHKPGIRWTELSKANYIEPQYYEHLLPYYEALTTALRDRQGR